jgi:predicted RNA binding protein YcfA (HicA-like mRNA interferase family)
MGHSDGRRVTIPNPHGSDLDWTLVKRILAQADISNEQWDALS